MLLYFIYTQLPKKNQNQIKSTTTPENVFKGEVTQISAKQISSKNEGGNKKNERKKKGRKKEMRLNHKPYN